MMLLRALWGVATSPPMPRYPVYVAAVDELKRDERAFNPPADAIGAELVSLVSRRNARVDAELPWVSRSVTCSRLLSAITSFTDDYDGPFPAEFFPEPVVLELLHRLEGRAFPLSVVEQLDLALDLGGGSIFAGATLLHAVTRVLARGRDTRALPSLRLDLAQRLERGRAIAAFRDDDSRGGDPLGDTYHYWAMVLGGLWCEGRQDSLAARPAQALLYNGADLMWLVRDRLFGSRLFFGRHKHIDRMGLAHGLALGNQRRRRSYSCRAATMSGDCPA